MYLQGVCRIRKPACAGNGCAIFPIFQTDDWEQKIRRSAADDLFRVSVVCLSALLKLLLAELEGIELIVATLLVEKLLVGALLHDLAVGQQDDVVCVLDGA